MKSVRIPIAKRIGITAANSGGRYPMMVDLRPSRFSIILRVNCQYSQHE